MPGLVELHTDHLEGHYAPRPKVRWNPFAAVQAHDAQIASSAITTVFDALRVGNTDGDHDLITDDMVVLAEAIQSGMATGRLRADHFLHLRCEGSSPDCLAAFERLGGKQGVRLASLMDHAPGQRQFANLDAYKIYYQGKLKMTDAEFAAFCDMRVDQSRQNSDQHRSAPSPKSRGSVASCWPAMMTPPANTSTRRRTMACASPNSRRPRPPPDRPMSAAWPS